MTKKHQPATLETSAPLVRPGAIEKLGVLAKLRDESPVWTVREAAAYCHLPLNRIRTWIARGEISYRAEGKCFLLKKSEVIAMLERDWQRGSIKETPRKLACG
jgi:excisionase family DNA binding protein